VFVISSEQEAIGRYFDRAHHLESALKRQGKDELLQQMLEIADIAEISYIYQKEQLGLGHAVLTARLAVGREPFAVFLPDDVIWNDQPTIGQMIDIFDEHGSCVISVKEVPDEAVPNLGIVDAVPINDRVSKIRDMVEKPRLEDAPSNLAIIGRYILTPEVFDALENVTPGAVGEIQLTDAIRAVISTQGAYAYRFPGDHFDLGTPVGMLKASIYAALHRADMSREIREWIEEAIARDTVAD
jgi:UTP--glucose-1-phosphate uridylyltransferase